MRGTDCMKMRIKLNSVDDAVSLVNKLSEYDCEADLISGCYYADAKSIVGVMGIGIQREMLLVVHSDEQNKIKKDLERFIS